MMVNYGGSQLSCSDSSNSSLIVFLRECPYTCFYCQNPKLREGESFLDIEEIKQQILENLSLISEVIFSGGEPIIQIEAIKELSKFSKELNLKVGIETSGYNSGKLLNLLKYDLIDEVFLDVKTFGEEEYYKLTGVERSWNEVLNLIGSCIKLNKNIEIRTTIFKDYPRDNSLIEIENLINKLGLSWKKQEGYLNDRKT